jgi:hypothetical protein
MEAILIDLGILALSLAIAGLLIARSKYRLAIIFGLVPIILLELGLQIIHVIYSQQCVNANCALLNLLPGCTYGREACAEEMGLRSILFWAVGFIDLFLFIIGVVIQYVIHSRRKMAGAARSGPYPNGAS